MSYRTLQILDAIRAGDISFLNSEVTRANVNFIDPETRLSLLMWAIDAGQLPCLLLLLSRGASLLPVDRLGFTVLHRAVWSGSLSMIRALLLISPDTIASAASAATDMIVSPSSAPAVSGALAEGERRHVFGGPLLSTSSSRALHQGNQEGSRQETAYEGPSNGTTSPSGANGMSEGNTGMNGGALLRGGGGRLHMEGGLEESQGREWLTPRARPSLRWRKGGQRLVNAIHPLTGRTPLMLAAVRGSASIVQFLVNVCEADIYFRDNEGFTAFDLAAMCGHLHILHLFLSKADGDGLGNAFPFLQQRAELFGENAKTIHQRQVLNEMNRMMSADFARQSYVSAR